MKLEDYFDMITNAVREQYKRYMETGVVLPLKIKDHCELTIDPNDPPDVRRRVILYRARLQEWRDFGEKQDAAREHAYNICIVNIESIFDNLI